VRNENPKDEILPGVAKSTRPSILTFNELSFAILRGFFATERRRIRSRHSVYVCRPHTTHATRSLSLFFSLSLLFSPLRDCPSLFNLPPYPRSPSRRRSRNGVFSGNRLSVVRRIQAVVRNCYVRVPRTYRVVRNEKEREREQEKGREGWDDNPWEKEIRRRTVPRGRNLREVSAIFAPFPTDILFSLQNSNSELNYCGAR